MVKRVPMSPSCTGRLDDACQGNRRLPADFVEDNVRRVGSEQAQFRSSPCQLVNFPDQVPSQPDESVAWPRSSMALRSMLLMTIEG